MFGMVNLNILFISVQAIVRINIIKYWNVLCVMINKVN